MIQHSPVATYRILLRGLSNEELLILTCILFILGCALRGSVAGQAMSEQLLNKHYHVKLLLIYCAIHSS